MVDIVCGIDIVDAVGDMRDAMEPCRFIPGGLQGLDDFECSDTDALPLLLPDRLLPSAVPGLAAASAWRCRMTFFSIAVRARGKPLMGCPPSPSTCSAISTADSLLDMTMSMGGRRNCESRIISPVTLELISMHFGVSTLPTSRMMN